MIRRVAVWGGAALLVIAYALFYTRSAEVPHGGAPGWWRYWDQGWYLRSATAFARGDLSPGSHWYAPGYALLGAPFVAANVTVHPFALVDLLCLLGTYACFLRVSSCCAVPAHWGAVLFCTAALWNQQVFWQWVLPWNTSPVALLMWGVLALAGGGRPLLMGVLAGLVAWFRAPDFAPAALCLLLALVHVPPRAWAKAGLGVVAALLPLAALHLAIYGPHPSPYMLQSASLGFSLDDFGWKSFVMLSDPRAWFGEGAGLLRRLPWVALGLAGLLPALLGGGAARIVACGLIAHLLLYLSYVDLLPTGLWHYNNIHYFGWALPGYGLLGLLLLRDLRAQSWPRRAPALAGTVAVLALSCVRIAPRPAEAAEPAKMLILPGPTPSLEASYFGDASLADAIGPMHNITDYRALPDPRGLRVIALRRHFIGPIASVPSAERYAASVSLGLPCWLPLVTCAAPSASR